MALPYQGNKQEIAEDLLLFLRRSFPEKQNFYDLFGGGGNISEVAIKYWKRVVYNELNTSIYLAFKSLIDGTYEWHLPKSEFITGEMFKEIKASEHSARRGLVLCCWSFGNNQLNYLYSKEIEPWKQALHNAKVLNDYSMFEEMEIHSYGNSIHIQKNKEEFKQKYIKWFVKKFHNTEIDLVELSKNLTEKIKDNEESLRNYLLDSLKKSGLTQSEVGRRLNTQMHRHYFGKSQWSFPTIEEYNKMREFMELAEYYEVYGLQDLYESLQRLQSLQSLESLESLERLQRLQSLESLERLQSYNFDYKDVFIKENSMVYCDIPYNSNKTKGSYGLQFDHETFYKWAADQNETVVFSDYLENVPKEFEVIWSKSKVNKLAGGGGKKSTEILAWNKKGNLIQTTLF